MRISSDYITEFINLFENARDNQFRIGDLLLELVFMNGDKKAVLNQVAGELNVTYSTLLDYCRIAEKWKPADRITFQGMDWTIYRNLDPVEDRELLEQGITEGWNATRFKEEKYPEMKNPVNVIGRVAGTLARYREQFPCGLYEKIDKICLLLHEVEDELEAVK